MNVLLINHYAGSPEMGMEFRPYYLAKEWEKQKIKTTIVAANHSHVRSKQPEKTGTQKIDEIDYLWLNTPKYKGNGIARFVNMLVFVLGLFFKIPFFCKKVKPDYVIASSTYPLDIFPAWVTAKLCKAKLVFEIHDLWPLSPMELGGMSKWHPFIMIMRFGEWFAYKFSDKIISILPNTYEHVKKDGVEQEKFFHIPNGINMDEWKKPAALPKKLDEKIKAKKPKLLIGYAGGHNISNALYPLLEAAVLLKNENIHIFMVGSGSEKNTLMKSAIDNELNNISFWDKIPKKSMPTFLKKMDILFIEFQKQPLYRFGVSPNKIFDYMMSGKPIIQAIKASNDMTGNAKCGFSIEPNNPKMLADTIKKASATPKQKLTEMGKNGIKYAQDNHDYKVLAQKFTEALKA